MNLTIGISYAPKGNPRYLNYVRAIEHAAKDLEYDVNVVVLTEDPASVAAVDGIVFTGGADIQPARYGKQAEEGLCSEIDETRDNAEFAIAANAEEAGLPILGICRGAQLLNVHRGGTLITDLQTFGGHDHKRISQDQDNRHNVKVTPGSYLSRMLRTNEGEINSAHHQAIERLGDGLTVVARDPEDGTVEAVEWADPTGKPFLLAVQWHPERMDYDEKFAGRLFETFLWEVAAQKMLKNRLGTLTPRREEEKTPEERMSESRARGLDQQRSGWH